MDELKKDAGRKKVEEKKEWEVPNKIGRDVRDWRHLTFYFRPFFLFPTSDHQEGPLLWIITCLLQ